MQKPKFQSERGLSLIELLLVIVTIGVLVAVAIPAIQRSLQAYSLESASGMISNSFAEARLYAIKRNRISWVTIDAATRSFRVWSRDDAGTVVALGPAKLLPEGVSLTNTSPTTVEFTSLGRNQANAVTNITLTNVSTGRSKRVGVSAIGKISVSNYP